MLSDFLVAFTTFLDQLPWDLLLSVTLGWFLFNGLSMLLFPVWWLKLPGWIGFHGTLAGADPDDIWVLVRVRGFGLVLTGFVLCCVWRASEGFSAIPRFSAK